MTHHTLISPNHESRLGRDISMLVIHATAGSAASALSWLTNPKSRVSAHYLIDKRGRVTQLVPDHRCAWHAGRSAWRGETQINECSIGIELENANTGRDPYPPAQCNALTALARQLIARYAITPENVVRHLDIAVPRGRKTDPAGFDWPGFRAQLFRQIPPPPPPPPPAVGRRYKARTQCYVRSEARTSSKHVRTIERDAIVPVVTEVEGQFWKNTWGSGNLWARVVDGYVWLPQLGATS